MVGGSDEGGVSVATNEVYDLATNRWSTARPMLTAVLGFDDAAFRTFITERRIDLPTFFLQGMRP